MNSLALFALYDLDIGITFPIQDEETRGTTVFKLFQVADRWESFTDLFCSRVDVEGGPGADSNSHSN